MGCLNDVQLWLADRTGALVRPLRGWEDITASSFRIIDNVSSLNVSFGDQCELDVLCDIEPWKNSLALLADGVVQWRGPITDTAFNFDATSATPFTVNARDALHWFSVRTLRGQIVAGPVANQFVQIIETAQEVDDLGITARANFLTVEGRLRITDVTGALDELIDLAPFLDFTWHGDELLVGSEEVPFAELSTLVLPDMATNFTLRQDGSSIATEVWVRGGEDFEDPESTDRAVGVWPQQREADPVYGVISRRVYDASILENETATVAAFSYYRYSEPPVWEVEADIDLCKTPWNLFDLIAGAVMDVAIPTVECFGQQTMRIRDIGLDITPESEIVTLKLQPVGVFAPELGDLDSFLRS